MVTPAGIYMMATQGTRNSWNYAPQSHVLSLKGTDLWDHISYIIEYWTQIDNDNQLLNWLVPWPLPSLWPTMLYPQSSLSKTSTAAASSGECFSVPVLHGFCLCSSHFVSIPLANLPNLNTCLLYNLMAGIRNFKSGSSGCSVSLLTTAWRSIGQREPVASELWLTNIGAN